MEPGPGRAGRDDPQHVPHPRRLPLVPDRLSLKAGPWAQALGVVAGSVLVAVAVELGPRADLLDRPDPVGAAVVCFTLLGVAARVTRLLAEEAPTSAGRPPPRSASCCSRSATSTWRSPRAAGLARQRAGRRRLRAGAARARPHPGPRGLAGCPPTPRLGLPGGGGAGGAGLGCGVTGGWIRAALLVPGHGIGVASWARTSGFGAASAPRCSPEWGPPRWSPS